MSSLAVSSSKTEVDPSAAQAGMWEASLQPPSLSLDGEEGATNPMAEDPSLAVEGQAGGQGEKLPSGQEEPVTDRLASPLRVDS